MYGNNLQPSVDLVSFKDILFCLSDSNSKLLRVKSYIYITYKSPTYITMLHTCGVV